MILFEVDVNKAIEKLSTLSRLTGFNMPSERSNLADIIATSGKNSFAAESLQRIMTNRSPLVKGPYKTGKRGSIRKSFMSQINPNELFISYVSRQKNVADVSIGISLARLYIMPPDQYSEEAGLFSQIMGPLIPYDFAGELAANPLLIRHFGSGLMNIKPGYPNRAYPNQIALFANVSLNNRSIASVAKFLRAETLQQYLSDAELGDYAGVKKHEGFTIEDQMAERLGIETSKQFGLGGSSTRGASRSKKSNYFVRDMIGDQIGESGLAQLKSGAPYGKVAIVKKLASGEFRSLVLWHQGVPSYGWFRDFNGLPYQSDIAMIRNNVDKIVEEFLKLHGIK